MLNKIFLICCILAVSCKKESPKNFPKSALQEKLYNLEGNTTTFKEVLNNNKGQKILIDFWASWCKDCIQGLPKVKILQKEFPDVKYLFLSVDTKKTSWKYGVNKYKIDGIHYNLPNGSKEGVLVNFLQLDWIPRYVLLDEMGKIVLFKITDASNKELIKALKQKR